MHQFSADAFFFAGHNLPFTPNFRPVVIFYSLRGVTKTTLHRLISVNYTNRL